MSKILKSIFTSAIIILLITNCSNPSTQTNEEANSPSIEKIPLTKTQVSAQTDFFDFKISGYGYDTEFLGILEHTTSQEQTKEAYGFISGDTASFRIQIFNKVERSYVINAVLEDKKLYDFTREDSAVLNNYKINSTKANNLYMQKCSFEKSEDKKLFMTYPQFSEEAENAIALNECIEKKVFAAFDEKIENPGQMNEYYKNMEGSVTGNIWYIIAAKNKNLMCIKCVGQTMSMNGNFTLPSYFLVDLQNAKITDSYEYFDFAKLDSALNKKFAKRNQKNPSLSYQKSNGQFTPVAHIESENGVVFLNETGTVFNSSIFLTKDEVEQVRN